MSNHRLSFSRRVQDNAFSRLNRPLVVGSTIFFRQNRFMSRYIVLIAVSALASVASCFSQSCKKQWSTQVLSQTVREAGNADVVYRACAIKGSELRPVLQDIAKAGSSISSVAGAAQVCLAKLGDETSLDQLRNELISQKYNQNAIYKLARASTSESIAILMDYLVRYQNDSSKIINMGDTVYDPSFTIMQEMEKAVPRPPDIDLKRMSPSIQIQKWQEWWQQRKTTALFPPLEKYFPGDPYIQCLARKVEWEFPDALLDLDANGQDGMLTGVLKDLSGPESAKASAFHTVRGNAQTILAKHGNKQEFERIIAELNTTQYVDAIPKLLYIGNLKSAGVLVDSLDLTNFFAAHEKMSPQLYASETNRYLKSVFAALAAMAQSPPVAAQAPPTKENIERWKQWWKKGQTAESLSPPPHGTFE
jgi:hypothetical protein